METRNVPVIVMLSAGLITSIVMYRNEYSLITTLQMVLLVFFVFYIFGCLIKRLLDKFCPIETEEEEEDKEEQGEGEEKEGEEQNQDGSVIEKK